MGKSKTQEQFINQVKEICDDKYIFLETYKGAKTPILVRHNNESCDYKEFLILPDKFLNNNQRCPICSEKERVRKKTRTNEQFIKEVYNLVNNEYTFLEDYKGITTDIKVEHNICGYEYYITPNEFLNKGSRCPQCFGTPKKTQEQFKKEVFDLVGDEYTVVGQYDGADKHIKIKHNICNHEYSVFPTNFLYKERRCPICNESKGERCIREILNKNNIKFIPQKTFDGLLGLGNGNLSYDFYLSQYNLLIEYQGEFHDGSGREYTKTNLIQQQEHDKRKKEYANNHNIKLLEIWYYDFDNIEQILSKELNILKLIKQVV